jgi:hypothetical protein
VDAAEVSGVTAADTLEVDRATLLPVRREAAGGATVSLRFTGNRVAGRLVIGQQTMPVDVLLEGAVFSEGAGRDALLATLPLAEGYEGGMRIFALLTQKVRPMKIAVTGSETVTTGAGTFETFVVALSPLDGDESGTATLHVTRAAPHVIVRGTTSLPAMMGGGTQEVELAARK